jgi:hypothetical protein
VQVVSLPGQLPGAIRMLEETPGMRLPPSGTAQEGGGLSGIASAVGLVFGLAGVAVAAPLTVVLHVLVEKLCLRQAPGERTEVPGEEWCRPRQWFPT